MPDWLQAVGMFDVCAAYILIQVVRCAAFFFVLAALVMLLRSVLCRCVFGKGTYVAAANAELLLEEQKKELEADLELAVLKGRRFGISDEDIRSLFELVLEE